MSNYIPIIGLEIHVELATRSKMFCQCSADYFGKEPNTHVCPVCLGLPGALPVPNKKAIEWAICIAQALGCHINAYSKFDRKHYFYPDLPKGYQISQYDKPFGYDGAVSLDVFKNKEKEYVEETFRIRRVHLEEDTGKLIHGGDETLVDFNRSSVPLVEIVTQPDFHSGEYVKRFLEELQTIVRYLGVSDADMEKGSMRMEPNISLLPCTGDLSGDMDLSHLHARIDDGLLPLPGYKVEVKNINSFRFVKLAVEHEIERQVALLERGERVKQETRGFDEKTGKTYAQRSKEDAHDYRYFPEPDIPPLVFDQAWLDSSLHAIPELPHMRLERYVREYDLRYQDALILTRNREIADQFEEIVVTVSAHKDIPDSVAQKVANVIVNKKIGLSRGANAFVKEFLAHYKPKEVDTAILDGVIERVIVANQKAVDDYKKGKESVIMFLVGQAMRELRGKAPADVLKEKIVERISP